MNKDFNLGDKLEEDERGKWSEPILLNKIIAPPFPPGILPHPIAEAAETVAKSHQTPLGLFGGLALSALASVVGKKYVVQVRRDYDEQLNLYLAAVLMSGGGKSHVFKRVVAPIFEWEQRRRAEVGPRRESAESMEKTILRRIEKKRLAAASATSDEAFLKIQHEIGELEKKIPRKPVIPQIYTEDSTPEKFAQLMAEQEHEKLSILSDEGGIFDILDGLYGVNGSNIDIFLKGFSMNCFKQERIGRGSIYIKDPLSSIGLAVQPDVIEDLGKNKKFRGRGLIARFIFLVLRNTLGYRVSDPEPLNWEHVGRYNSMITHHLDTPWNTDQAGRIIPYTLTLSPGAYRLWRIHFDSIEARMGPGGPLENMKDIGGKAPGMAIKFAGLFHASRVLFYSPTDFEISEEIMGKAIALNEVALANDAVILRVMNMDEDTKKIIEVWRWIRNRTRKMKSNFFTRRECQQNMKNRKIDRQSIDRALNELSERYYIRDMRPGANQGKGYTVSPIALKKDN